MSRNARAPGVDSRSPHGYKGRLYTVVTGAALASGPKRQRAAAKRNVRADVSFPVGIVQVWRVTGETPEVEGRVLFPVDSDGDDAASESSESNTVGAAREPKERRVGPSERTSFTVDGPMVVKGDLRVEGAIFGHLPRGTRSAIPTTLQNSVTSTSMRLIFGRVVCSCRVLDARRTHSGARTLTRFKYAGHLRAETQRADYAEWFPWAAQSAAAPPGSVVALDCATKTLSPATAPGAPAFVVSSSPSVAAGVPCGGAGGGALVRSSTSSQPW